MTSQYQILRSVEEFNDLRAPWTALLQLAEISSPFLTWEWMFTWWQHYCVGDKQRRLAIIVARNGNEIVAILPGYVRRVSTFGAELSEFAFLGTEYESTDYLQVVGAAGGTTLLPAMLEFLMKEEPGLDAFVMENVLETHPLLQSLRTLASRSGFSYEREPHRTCPYLDIRGDWEAYLAGLSAKMRKNVRRATRQLLDKGAEFSLVSDRAEVASAVADLFRLHERRFASKNASTGFRADLRQPFHARVSELFLDRGILRLFRVVVKRQTVATLYCFEFGGGLFYFQSGMDPAWEKLSVGTALVGHAVKHAFDSELNLFDFMRGSEEYKFRWTNSVREIVVVRVGTSWKGRTAFALRRQVLKAKRLAKRIVRPESRASAPAPVATA